MTLQRTGWIYSLKNFSVWACWVTGRIYQTMKFESEAIIAAEIGKFLMNGSLYRGSKPVMWSPVEKTALAEAEVEYSDHKSVTIYANFTLRACPVEALIGTKLVIWTTTPWTMPGNRAMACGADIHYSALKIEQLEEGSLARIGDVICLADDLIETVCKETGIAKTSVAHKFTGAELEGSIASHPLSDDGYDHDVPVLLADYVTTDQGTGFVHIAPGHGPEDYQLAHLVHGIEVPDTVGEDGVIAEHLPLFGGCHVLRDNQKIADVMAEKGGLIGIGTLVHSYPHSWRSHAPVIYRNATQWFVSMGDNQRGGLRETALNALSQTDFYPQAGQRRLSSMIENRPDWCLSRQRAWGVPIAVFYHKQTGEPLRDQAVIDRIVDAFKEEDVMRGLPRRLAAFWAIIIRQMTMFRSWILLMSGLIQAQPMPLCWNSVKICKAPLICILKVLTSIAAGFIPACFKAAAPEVCAL